VKMQEDKIAPAEQVEAITTLEPESGLKRRNANTQLDDAAKLLEESGTVEFSLAEQKRVLRKIDIYVCIPLCLVYFIQQVPRLRRMLMKDGQINIVVRCCVWNSSLSRTSRKRVLLAWFNHLHSPVGLPATIFVCPDCVSGQVLGDVQYPNPDRTDIRYDSLDRHASSHGLRHQLHRPPHLQDVFGRL
jgi:hypothetical protein